MDKNFEQEGKSENNRLSILICDETPYGKRLLKAWNNSAADENKLTLATAKEDVTNIIEAESADIILLGKLGELTEKDFPYGKIVFYLSEEPDEGEGMIFKYQNVKEIQKKIKDQIPLMKQLQEYETWKAEKAENSILVFSSVGGRTGTTSCAMIAANVFAQKGEKVLFIDAGIPGDSALSFGAKETQDFYVSEYNVNILQSGRNSFFEIKDLNSLKAYGWDRIIIDAPIHLLLEPDIKEAVVVYVYDGTDENYARMKKWWGIKADRMDSYPEKDWLLYNYNEPNTQRIHLPGLKILGAIQKDETIPEKMEHDFWEYLSW